MKLGDLLGHGLKIGSGSLRIEKKSKEEKDKIMSIPMSTQEKESKLPKVLKNPIIIKGLIKWSLKSKSKLQEQVSNLVAEKIAKVDK
jgi:hypothetical protein